MQYAFTNRDNKEIAAEGSILTASWTEGDKDKAPPTNADLDAQASSTATTLYRRGQKCGNRQLQATAQAIRQAGKLNKATGRYQSCETLACPREEARRQRWLTKQAYQVLTSKRRWKKSVLLSLVSEIGVVDKDMLTLFGLNGGTGTCRTVFQHLTDTLNDNGVEHSIGGLDISYAVDGRVIGEHGFRGPNVDDHWLIHVTVMMPLKTFRRIETKLREAYPKTELVPKPISMRQWDGDPRAIAYVFKRLAAKSADIVRSIYLRDKGREESPRQNTRAAKLPSKRRVELLVMLDQLAPDCRYLLWGMKPQKGTTGLSIALNK
jgi:hypothetical protein